MWEVLAMDDKELIKKIMEEVKDEKLREELLALVVEKSRKREDDTKGDTAKQGEGNSVDYVVKQTILFGATEGVAKVGWWIMYIISIVFILVGGLYSLGLIGYFLTPAEKRTRNPALAVLLSFLLIPGLAMFFTLRSGKKEYERLKGKKENQEQS
jgi:4-amino-4-deoxy-L-arabinose transferase-like glycosyltransferase